MNEVTIHLVEGSFKEIALIKEEAAALFYDRLFVIDPSLKGLFSRSDMKAQGLKLMAALALVVANLRSPQKVLPSLEAMAVRHVRYGAQDGHYTTVGLALVETLELAFGQRFTPELRSAWIEAYDMVSSSMRAAARHGRAEPRPTAG